MAGPDGRSVCLLEDLEEIDRFDGTANGVKARDPAVREQSRGAADRRRADAGPAGGPRYGVIRRVHVHDGAGGDDRPEIALSKLAKRTEEFRAKLAEALDTLRKRTASALHDRFAFLDPDRLRQLLVTMPEGRSAEMPSLAAVHPKTAGGGDRGRRRRGPQAVFRRIAGAIDRVVARRLQVHAAGGRRGGIGGRRAVLLVLPADEGKDAVAWEATTGTGRATYFFRASTPVEQMTRGLALINFRREPIYLPDASLEQQPRYRRYVIGARKLADLRSLRGAYLGRAIHSSVEEWAEQVRRFV